MKAPENPFFWQKKSFLRPSSVVFLLAPYNKSKGCNVFLEQETKSKKDVKEIILNLRLEGRGWRLLK